MNTSTADDKKSFRKKTLTNNLGVNNLNATLENTDRDSSSGNKGIKSKISLLSDCLDHCRALAEEVNEDLDRLKPGLKSSHKGEFGRQAADKTSKPEESGTLKRIRLKRHAEEQVNHSSAKRTKLELNVNSKTTPGFHAHQAIDSQCSTRPSENTKVEDKDLSRSAGETAISDSGNEANAILPITPGPLDISLASRETQDPWDESEAEREKREMLAGLGGLWQQMYEHQKKLKIYLEQLAIQHEASEENRQEIVRRYQSLKTFRDSIPDFTSKLMGAIIAL